MPALLVSLDSLENWEIERNSPSPLAATALIDFVIQKLSRQQLGGENSMNETQEELTPVTIGGGRRLRHFVWSLWNGWHLINLFDL
jgi:hypothetical protein